MGLIVMFIGPHAPETSTARLSMFPLLQGVREIAKTRNQCMVMRSAIIKASVISA